MNADDQSLQILLVEDNAADAKLTMDALGDCRLANMVHWVRNAAEAFDFLFGRGPASVAGNGRLKLVLLGLGLPHVNGLDVLRVLRADMRTQSLPVVVLATSHEQIDLTRAYNMGVNSYLVKPIEAADFMKAVSEIGLYWMRFNQLPVK